MQQVTNSYVHHRLVISDYYVLHRGRASPFYEMSAKVTFVLPDVSVDLCQRFFYLIKSRVKTIKKSLL